MIPYHLQNMLPHKEVKIPYPISHMTVINIHYLVLCNTLVNVCNVQVYTNLPLSIFTVFSLLYNIYLLGMGGSGGYPIRNRESEPQLHSFINPNPPRYSG